MGRESREVWEKRVERWRDSGLSATEFAAEIGVNANSLKGWSWRIKNEHRRSEAKPTPTSTATHTNELTWVEVVAPPSKQPTPVLPLPNAPSEKLELVLASGMTVRVPTHFDAAVLRRLLTVIG